MMLSPNFLLFLAPFLFSTQPTLEAQDHFTSNDPIKNIYKGIPEDLNMETLLVPRFDLMDPEQTMVGSRRDLVISINKQAKKGNTTLKDIIDKNYQYEYRLSSLREIQKLRDQGYKYFMDMVLMPKQLLYPKKEAMTPAFIKYPTANKMFTNRYSQFHYYFYIRDLRTDDAYITSKFKGHPEVYRGISKFLKQVAQEM